MTTEQLRKEIMVTNWHIGINGLSLEYWQNDIKTSIFYPPGRSVRLLNIIGSIDSCSEDGTILIYNGTQMHWISFIGCFTFSQWEALTLVIRHELEKETEKEIDNSDIGKAIDKLK